MKTRLRILMKLMLILLLAVCFLILMKRDTRVFRMKQPEGEGITVEDAVILMQALKENAVLNETVSENLGKWLDQQKISYAEKEYEKLLYGDYIDLVRMLTDDHEFEMEEKYREDFYLLKEDWYQSYDWYVEFAIRKKEKEFREQHIVPMSEAYMLLKENTNGEKSVNND